MKNKSKYFIILIASLVLMQILTILSSWIVSAVWPSLGIKSLLSGSGLRWLLCNMPFNLSNHYFIYFLLWSIFGGTFVYSGLPKKIIMFSKNDFRERFAINIFFLIVIVAILVGVILAIFPHSSFLGVTGHIYPGPYLSSLMLLFGLAIFGGSMAFLFLSGKVSDWKEAEKACVFGLQSVAPVVIIYFLLKALVEMVRFAI